MGQNREFLPGGNGGHEPAPPAISRQDGSALPTPPATTGHLPPPDATAVAGSGSVAARHPQSVLDALADAETLRRVMLSLHPFYVPRDFRQALIEADGNGNTARFQATTRESWAPGADAAAFSATHAARSAFRAVPGLRA